MFYGKSLCYNTDEKTTLIILIRFQSHLYLNENVKIIFDGNSAYGDVPIFCLQSAS